MTTHDHAATGGHLGSRVEAADALAAFHRSARLVEVRRVEH
jgi:hypothetical protein